MSAVVKSAETQRRMRLDRTFGDSDHILVSLDDGHLRPDTRFMAEIRPTRADFLAAVATECGVIIIDRADLPEVETSVPGFGPHYALVRDGKVHESSFTYAYPAAPASSASWHRRTAEGHLALAEHLDAHPPIDEAQVEVAYDVVQDALREAGVTMGQVDHGVRMSVARRLIAAGWSK